MSFKTITVFVDASTASAARLETAVDAFEADGDVN